MTSDTCSAAKTPAEHAVCHGWVTGQPWSEDRPCGCTCHVSGNYRRHDLAHRPMATPRPVTGTDVPATAGGTAPPAPRGGSRG